MRALLHRLSHWLWKKTMPAALTGGQWSGSSYVDAFKRTREPTPNELMLELKGTAWACISINAAVSASFPPRLFVASARGQARPKCAVKSLSSRTVERLRSLPHLGARARAAEAVEEVVDHPLLTLLRQVNPIHNAFDLWELTQVYLEVHGRAFWFLERGPLGLPDNIWILPSQNVTPKRAPDSPRPVDYYQYRTGAREQRFAPEDVIFFRYPDPRDPYTGGLSPLRACFEQASLASEYAATRSAIYENRALPSALVSPDAVLGEEERDRLEHQINSKFRRGGTGKILVAESSLKVQLLSQSLGDLAALADLKATKEDIAAAFHVPVAFLTSETNLANLQAAEHQHMAKAITPRLQRRDQKLNEQLIPLYDPSGRLFLASEDPVPVNFENNLKELEVKLKYGVWTINEVRTAGGQPPVPWGEAPWLPYQWLPADTLQGRGRPDDDGQKTEQEGTEKTRKKIEQEATEKTEKGRNDPVSSSPSTTSVRVPPS
jgi:HK97 family phage portal protein